MDPNNNIMSFFTEETSMSLPPISINNNSAMSRIMSISKADELDILNSQIDAISTNTESQIVSNDVILENDEYLEGEEIYYSNDPTQAKWCFIPLFIKDQTGKQRRWQIGFLPESNQIITISGQIGSLNPIKCKTDVVLASKKTYSDQALQIARNKYNKKYRNGFRPIGAVSNARLNAQLAPNKLYKPEIRNEENDIIQKSQVKKFPAEVTPKMDGGRALAFQSNNSEKPVIMVTRENNEWLYLFHIKAELELFFKYLNPGVGVDGELYSNKIDFQKLISIIRTTKRRHAEDESVEYYIFDIIIPNVTRDDRRIMTFTAYRRFIEDGHVFRYCHIVPGTVCYSHQDILDCYTYYLNEGFEGIIIKKMAGANPSKRDVKQSLYTGKRNQNWLKLKPELEEEGTVINVTSEFNEKNGQRFELAMFIVRRDNGLEFTVRPKGTFEKRARWFMNRHELIGKRYTYKFQELTNDGIPRFPIGKAFRDYE